ncbi:MAG: menaquinone-dependent protoporphyrinogen IX dehydrogenase [Thiotrichales bacterium]
MSGILILYSTVDGHTKKICEFIRDKIQPDSDASEVTLAALDDAHALALDSFDKIVIGASIRYGKHRPAVFEFVEKNLALLEQKPNAFFTVNVVARKPEKNRPDTNPYMKKFLTLTPWKPKKLAVFAGKIDYQKYGFMDRNMIRFIMWLTKGPTAADTNVEFTLWDEVEAFAGEIQEM